ncbi:MAG: sugar ABC transporter permease [Lachnospiraceae bacterium]|jgi:putative aldouronate transport system permease protein|nr:ABC transporter permease subunit [uncultured Acetatifactor sp.]MCI9219358.1 sugar ABC transporter permease [Lachnospiraceae bacterium]
MEKTNAEKKFSFGEIWKRMWKCRDLYLFLFPALVLLILFTYCPMYGVQIAFRDFVAEKGIWGSEWVGLKYFKQFINSYQFGNTLKNTLVLSVYCLLVTFPLPIMLALLCNQMRNGKFKKVFQVVTYLPHFISTVVVCGMILMFLSPSSGIIAQFLSLAEIKMPNIMSKPGAFPSIYVWTEAWQHIGFDSIVHIAALSAIDPSLYEAATMDGASKWQKMTRIDFPLLLPTVTIMFILRMGSLVSIGFEKVYLLQNSLNISTSEILSTYVYKMGLIGGQYSLSAAINMFNSIINLILLLTVNYISAKLSDTSLI